MAKRIVKWTLDNGILKLSRAVEDDKAEVVIEAEFDLSLLFTDFKTFTEVQQQTIIYGVKQKLMDVGANEIGDAQSKFQRAKTKWEELLAGKWAGERVNATGAAENKRIAAEVKAVIGTVTLQGLLLKQMMKPAEFTEEDKKKLEEFMREVLKNQKK